MSDVSSAIERALPAGPSAITRRASEQGKLPVRERVARLLDEGSLVEEALLANWEQDGPGADGVVTGHRHDRRRGPSPSWPTTRR